MVETTNTKYLTHKSNKELSLPGCTGGGVRASTGVGGAAGAGLDTGDEEERTAGGVGAGLLVGGTTALIILLLAYKK